MDEGAFIEAARRLRGLWALSGDPGKILLEAVNSYWDALHSVHIRSRWLSLWSAFERAVNHDGVGRSGKRFDQHASSATGTDCADIARLRELNNQLKHADALSRLASLRVEVKAVDAGTLKRLCDKSLATRIGFNLSGHYEE